MARCVCLMQTPFPLANISSIASRVPEESAPLGRRRGWKPACLGSRAVVGAAAHRHAGCGCNHSGSTEAHGGGDV
jgi:hypothetical protein